jgi:hypothetical protein
MLKGNQNFQELVLELQPDEYSLTMTSDMLKAANRHPLSQNPMDQ